LARFTSWILDKWESTKLKKASTETKRKAFDFNGFLSKFDDSEGKAAPKGLNKPALKPFSASCRPNALSNGLLLLTDLAF
jgi:hypothetical protein